MFHDGRDTNTRVGRGERQRDGIIATLSYLINEVDILKAKNQEVLDNRSVSVYDPTNDLPFDNDEAVSFSIFIVA